ncbi:MAG: YHS domain-containing protein [Deltaproteobacteria bacterium]
MLTQVSPAAGERWQVTLSQLDNNQYLMALARSPGAGKQFGQLDTVRQQRVGTSFAVADSDNPGPKCIISGGLGTMQVEYKGKSYPVCCSGCAAAFRDDPERWLAKLAEREKAKKNDD